VTTPELTGRYRWTALTNTTAAVLMSALDGSIALPAIFRGVHLDPLAPGNIAYLLWMIMGYRLVQAVLVVTVGRLGDMFGRVRIYNVGFAVFTVASILLSFDPFTGGSGAMWLIGWRVLQAVGGSMLTANSAAILTDAFPAEQRGFALGINQVAGLAGMFIGLIAGGLALLAAFVIIESRVAAPMIELSLFRLRAFTAGNIASLATSIGRGGLQFVLIIWLQGIWLPLHGYDYSATPLWAGIFMLPLTAGFLVAGPVSGTLSDRFGSRGLATAGALLFGASLLGLMVLPVNFSYWIFALLIALNGIASGMFASPNSSSIMGSVPPRLRGVASGMRATFQNTGTEVSIGVFFSLMIAGLASSLPHSLGAGLQRQGVPASVAARVATLPPVSSLFAAQLGVNPIQHLLQPTGTLATLTTAQRRTVTGHTFFPDLISGPFHSGLVVVFAFAAALALLAALASLLRGSPQPTPRQEAGHATHYAGPQTRTHRDRPAERNHLRADRASG
jgi:MFS family permease